MGEASSASDLPVRKVRRSASFGLCLTLALSCGLPLACSGESAGASVPASGSIQVVDLAGLDAAIAKHRGRGLLLNFWAIWCPPCVAELPELIAVGRELREQGGDVLLVSFDLMVPNDGVQQARTAVEQFAKKRGIDVPIAIYDGPDYDAINARFDLPGSIPATLALDREGRIVDREDGPADKERFTAMMRKALGK